MLRGAPSGVGRPNVRPLVEPSGLLPDDAKPLARWRLHDPPALYPSDPPGSQRLEPRDFCLDVVGLDIEVYATLVRDPLNLDI